MWIGCKFILERYKVRHIINVEVTWSDRNYCCGWGFEDVGAVLCTNKTLDGLKKEFEETLKFHVETMAKDDEHVPEWLLSGEYNIEYTLSP